MTEVSNIFMYELDDGSRIRMELNHNKTSVQIVHFDEHAKPLYQFRIKPTELEGLGTILKLIYTLAMPSETN